MPDDQFGFITDFTLRNVTAETCTLNGWVGVSLRGNATHQDCAAGEPATSCPPYPDKTSFPPQIYTHAPGSRPVTLLPSKSTRFSLEWEGTICLQPPYLVDFQIPGDPGRLRVTLPDMCSGPITITAIGVTG